MSDSKPQQSTYKGWLYKWTNYLKGYQKRWFVLQNGLLSYYRNQAEMTHTCRGTINLATAFITTSDSCTIVISSGGNHTFHLKATSEVDRQKWVTALELAKADAQRMLEPGMKCKVCTAHQCRQTHHGKAVWVDKPCISLYWHKKQLFIQNKAAEIRLHEFHPNLTN